MKPVLDDMITLPSGAERSAFDTNIPGQSLTKEPGLYPWDKPPMFNTPDEVMNHFVSKFSDDTSAKHLLSLMSNDVPLDTIIDSILLAGFSEGMFTPDVAILVAEDLGMLLMYLGDSAGVKYKITEAEEKVDVNDVFHQLAKGIQQKKDIENNNMPKIEEAPLQTEPSPSRYNG